MNSPRLHQKITSNEGHAARLADSDSSSAEIVNELYLGVFCRYPTVAEQHAAIQTFDVAGSRRAAVEDLMWAMLNSAEFVFKD